jgi:hypothetical protein
VKHPEGSLAMKRISQLDEDGCGVACVAMIAGVSYHEARKRMFGDQNVTVTRTRELREALRDFGIACTGKLIPSTRRRHYKKLEQDAILKVKSLRSGKKDWHWMVWDNRRKRALDPEKEKDDRYVRPPVRSFLEIER